MVTYNAFNPRTALLFLRTRVALGVKKAPTGLSKTASVFVSNGILGVSTKSSSKKVTATTIATGNSNITA